MNCKPGDIVTLPGSGYIVALVKPLKSFSNGTQTYIARQLYTLNCTDVVFVKSKGNNMLKEVTQDVRQFVKDNRNVVYTVVLIFLADHFLFKGVFLERLKAMAEKLLKKAEDKVELMK